MNVGKLLKAFRGSKGKSLLQQPGSVLERIKRLCAVLSWQNHAQVRGRIRKLAGMGSGFIEGSSGTQFVPPAVRIWNADFTCFGRILPCFPKDKLWYLSLWKNLFQGRMGPGLAGNRKSESRLVISIGNRPIICKISELSLVSRLINWGRIALALNRLYESTALRARIC